MKNVGNNKKKQDAVYFKSTGHYFRNNITFPEMIIVSNNIILIIINSH